MKTQQTHLSRPIKNRYGHFRKALTLSTLVIALLSAAISPQASAAEQRSQAVAQYPKVKLDGFELQRKDFRFGFAGFTGWLKRGGEWHIEGPVRHNGLFCGTYEIGMRFGIGQPECTDVQWVSGVRYVTSQNQCNNAEMPHSGSEMDESLTSQFDAISCAERVIRCTGTCK